MLLVVPIEEVELHIQQGYLSPEMIRIKGTQHQGSSATEVTCYPKDNHKKYTMVFQGSRVWETGIKPFFIVYVMQKSRHIRMERTNRLEPVSP